MRILHIMSLLVQQCLCSGPSAGNVSSQEISKAIDLDECIDFGNRTHIVHMGWPFRFDISDLAKPALRANSTMYRLYRKSTAKITSLNPDRTVRWNSTGILKEIRYSYSTKFDILDSTPQSFVLVMEIPEINHCSKMKIYLQKERLFENTTCFLPEFKVTEAVVRYKETFHFDCKVDDDNEDYEYEWLYNCSKNIPKNLMDANSSEITISQTEFENGGNYTCVIKYKGQTRYSNVVDVCVKRTHALTYSLTCNSKFKGKEGETMNITCMVNFGLGESINDHYSTTWHKGNSGERFGKICEKADVLSEEANAFRKRLAEDSRIQCESVKEQTTGRCYRYKPSVEEEPIHIFRLTMLIKNFSRSDAGQYLLNFSVTDDDFKTRMFVISLDEELDTVATSIAISVALLVMLLLLAILSVWMKSDILWFFKKYFGAFEKDDKQYMAYLAYHYSTDEMGQSSQDLIRKIVANVDGFIKKLNGRTYDDQRDGDPAQEKMEEIISLQEECHRVIVVLSKEYISDRWSMHKVYNAVQTMIEGGTKVIFILLPKVEKSFKGLPNKPRVALKHAMKMSTIIKWSGKIPLSGTFRRQLEYALPKLNRKGYQNEGGREVQSLTVF